MMIGLKEVSVLIEYWLPCSRLVGRLEKRLKFEASEKLLLIK